jgi:hypothetical protein
MFIHSTSLFTITTSVSAVTKKEKGPQNLQRCLGASAPSVSVRSVVSHERPRLAGTHVHR